MKFDFSDSRYVRMFEDSLEGRQILTYILNNPDLIRANYTFWKSIFPADNAVIPTDKTGRAAVRVDARKPEQATLADWRAPLGTGRLGEEGEAQGFNAGIIDLIALGWQEQAKEREYKEKIFSDFGSDAPLLLGYATDVVQPRVDSINMSISNMAAQALSTGQVIYNGGKGIHGPVYKAPVPAENFTNFTKVITDPDCDIFAEMVAIEKHYKEDVWGKENFAGVWDIPYDMFVNVFLKNAKIIEFMKLNWLADKGQLISQTSSVPGSIVTAEAFTTLAASRYPELSPINIIKESQFDEGTKVHGWKANTIVFRPRGIAGKTYRTENLDKYMSEKYGNSILTQVFATTMDGLMTVCHTTGINGKYKYWSADFMSSATPIIDVFLYQVIVDVSKAKAA